MLYNLTYLRLIIIKFDLQVDVGLEISVNTLFFKFVKNCGCMGKYIYTF